MEVHHPSRLNPKGKRVKEYFLEFLMIFLAVTLGFFAEGFRERLTENKMEKEFMNTLYADIKADTTDMHRVINANADLALISDSLLMILANKNHSQKELKMIYSKAIKIMNFELVDFHKIAVTELKNSGMSRFVRNRQVMREIIEYDLKIAEIEEQGDLVRDYCMKYIDATDQILNSRLLSKGGTISSISNQEKYTGSYSLLTRDSVKLIQYSNLIFSYASLRFLYDQLIMEQIKNAVELMEIIQKNYKIESQHE